MGLPAPAVATAVAAASAAAPTAPIGASRCPVAITAAVPSQIPEATRAALRPWPAACAPMHTRLGGRGLCLGELHRDALLHGLAHAMLPTRQQHRRVPPRLPLRLGLRAAARAALAAAAASPTTIIIPGAATTSSCTPAV